MTGRSPRSQVGKPISISWCVKARRYGARSGPPPVAVRHSLPRWGSTRQPWEWPTASQNPEGYSQACYATGENHERAVLRHLLGELDLEGVLIQVDILHTQQPFFGNSRSRGPTSSCRCSRRLLRRSRPTRRRCTARSAASSRESARYLSWQRIMRSATAASCPRYCVPNRHRLTSPRSGAPSAGSWR